MEEPMPVFHARARRSVVALMFTVAEGVAGAVDVACVPLAGEGALPFTVHAMVEPGVLQVMVTVREAE